MPETKVEKPKPEPKPKSDDYWISELVGALCDPIIVYPSPWMDTLPEMLKGQITLQRLVMNMRVIRGERPTGTDAEALAYMYPRCLEAPLGHDWTQIYLYLGTKVCSSDGKEMPADIRVEKLDNEQMRMLNELKAWIYEHRIRARKEKDRQARQEKKEQEKKELELQQYKFDF
jgi:hypothetical protein